MGRMQELPTLQNVKIAPSAPRQFPSVVEENLSDVQRIIAISSGKGGVGKSPVSVNLALALAKTGVKVGLMDGDVYGPSVPRMLDGFDKPLEKNGKLQPIEMYGIKMMSMGLLLDEGSPVIWRGPMATKLIQTFLMQVEWGKLDYLLIDLPPGTGDVQLTLTQAAPLLGAVVVTTPQKVAVDVTMRGIKMFEEVRVPILGVIENMSGFVCGHCDKETEVFQKGGGEETAKRLGFSFLGRVPLDPRLAMAGDAGRPVVDLEKESPPSATAFQSIVDRLVTTVESVEKENAATVMVDEVGFEAGRVLLKWTDGKEDQIPAKHLRYLCSCAECVSEDTGERLIQLENISEDIYPTGVKPIGRYGIQLNWSDGHGAGIYTFTRLKEIASA